MRILFYSSKPYDRDSFNSVNHEFGHNIEHFEGKLEPKTAPIASGFPAICAFVNDDLGAETLHALHEIGVKLVALRCAGFNQVDLPTAAKLGIKIVRVPAYSPHAVAEHTLALIMGLNRKTHRAYSRVREGNFELQGLLGFDLHGKTAGIIGTGKIGAIVTNILLGFGCEVALHDPYPNKSLEQKGAHYVSLDTLLAESDIISLHCPLTPDSHHLIDDTSIEKMKNGVCIVNTSRGGLIDAAAAIRGLKSGKIGYLGLDVYEEEGDLFFRDLSGNVIQDDIFSRLTTFPNVLITGHQAFFTKEALGNIAQTTLQNVTDFENGKPLTNEVSEKLMS
ncbi:MAG: 2-hydroxyacid dehydrogenase [Opitutales bacterium]